MRFPGICAIRSATGLWPFLILMIGAGLTLSHKDVLMEQSMPCRDPSGAETLERAEHAKPRKWNSRRAAAAAIAVAIPVIEPLGATLVPTGPDQSFDIGFHQDLQHRLGDGSQEIAIAALLQQFDKRHSLLGHRVLGGC